MNNPFQLGSNPLQLGQTVYHRAVYEHREPLKIVGIRQDELELEGDYSGGTHGVKQKQWLPLKGVSRIYNHAYKLECRQVAIACDALLIPADTKRNEVRSLLELSDRIQRLTTDVDLNPEL